MSDLSAIARQLNCSAISVHEIANAQGFFRISATALAADLDEIFEAEGCTRQEALTALFGKVCMRRAKVAECVA